MELEMKQLLFQDKSSGVMFFGIIIITNRRFFYEEIMCFYFPKTRKFGKKCFKKNGLNPAKSNMVFPTMLL
jgi:hypothetical protein